MAMQSQAISGATIPADGAHFRAPASRAELVRVEGLCKVYRSGSHEISPLDGISLSIHHGELVAIIGPSGSGKSTLLHLLAALDTPTNGAVYFAGNSLSSLPEPDLAEYRNSHIGFVWQRHHLLPDFTAAENVAMPLLVGGTALGQALRTAREWLGEVGLGGRSDQRAGELSGGEQQRVAIARALVKSPALLLADEPTGDLDEQNAEHIFDLMQRLHRSHHLTSVFATHNLALARRADRLLILGRGRLAPDAGPAADPAFGAAQTLGELG